MLIDIVEGSAVRVFGHGKTVPPNAEKGGFLAGGTVTGDLPTTNHLTPLVRSAGAKAVPYLRPPRPQTISSREMLGPRPSKP